MRMYFAISFLHQAAKTRNTRKLGLAVSIFTRYDVRAMEKSIRRINPRDPQSHG
jgi:hypothetical protein